MQRCVLVLTLVLVAGSGSAHGPAAAETAAERGREAVLRRPLNPAVWSQKAYDNLWKQWGLAEKPADYARAVQERYGLHPAPYDNQGLPLGLVASRSITAGKGIVNNCLLCHAGTIAGQTVLGLGNASIDLQSLYEELSAADRFYLQMPFKFSYVRGTVDPINPLTFLMQLRDGDLNFRREPAQLGYSADVASDPPAWWLLKRKKTRDWTGSVDARSNRVDMVNLLNPMNSAEAIKKQEGVFTDIAAFLLTVEAPKYPFGVDGPKAARGKELFAATCARCHGTYGEGGSYPNKVIDLETLGTDRTLAEALTPKIYEYFNQSWFARELGPDGQPYGLIPAEGYQAPPLDGVWATAPYFHNGSVPTLYHVLNSKARPAVYTRSYRTGKEEYDAGRLGWKVTVLEKAPDEKAPGVERRRVYDTTRRGQSNAGHTFGDKLSDEERHAVLEYLKTL